MSGPGCPSMAEYYGIRHARGGVELRNPEPAREHLDLGGGAWLTVRAGLPAARRELLREAARELVRAALAAEVPGNVPVSRADARLGALEPSVPLHETDGGRRGD